ncbi:hypothetical protein D3C78_1193490 [compost metagenome]
MVNIVWMMMIPLRFGMICFRAIRTKGTPRVFDAKTNSCSLSFIVWARITRAIEIQPVRARATIIEEIPGLKISSIRMTITSVGTPEMISSTRCIMLSVNPPFQPETRP